MASRFIAVPSLLRCVHDATKRQKTNPYQIAKATGLRLHSIQKLLRQEANPTLRNVEIILAGMGSCSTCATPGEAASRPGHVPSKPNGSVRRPDREGGKCPMAETLYRVVVIDDDEGEVYLLDEAIRISSVPVQRLPFRAAQKALEFFAQPTVPPIDLIIADLNLPIMTGVDLIVRLRDCAAASTVPMVISSTSQSGALPASLRAKLPVPFFTKQSSWQGYLRLARAILASLTARAAGVSAE